MEINLFVFSFVLEHELSALFVFVELFIYLIPRLGLLVHWVGVTLPLAPPPHPPTLRPLPLKPPTPDRGRGGGVADGGACVVVLDSEQSRKL